jgi:hypothetical protein
MAVRFECECGKKLKASDEKIGKKVLCSACGKTLTVPDVDTAPIEKVTLQSAPAPRAPAVSSANLASELLRRSGGEEERHVATERPVTLDRPTPRDKPAKKNRKFGLPGTDEPDIDYIASFKAIAMTILPGTLGIAALCFVCYTLASWVIGGSPEYPELHPVSGVVMYQGKPLPSADITFRPKEEKRGKDGKENVGSSFGKTDANGRYTLNYVPGVPGAVMGEHAVEIHAKDPKTRMEILPAKYHVRTTLSATVKKGDNENVDFQLTRSSR